MKKSFECVVLENVKIADSTYKMLFSAQEIADLIIPGQFVNIKVPQDSALLLRRPFSVSDVSKGKEGIIELIYRVTGKGTQLLSQVQKKEVIDVLGPLGNGFMKTDNVKKVFLVGGGCGIAPLKYLVKCWNDVKSTSFLGFKSKSFAYDVDHFKLYSDDLFISSDDGSIGDRGLVTDLLTTRLKIEKPEFIAACGPVPMLKLVQKLAAENSIPCQISLEERMGCGIGSCLVCVCGTQKEGIFAYKKVCSDGPVFWSDEVVLNSDES